MRNIERLAKHIAKHGGNDILVHTISGTRNWIICQKIEKDIWMLTLANPMGNITYNLGNVSGKQHLKLWEMLTKVEIEKKINAITLAKNLKDTIHRFNTKYQNKYKKFIKIKTKK